MITKEQHDRLSKYNQQLDTAYHLNYLRNLGREAVNELDIIYQEIFNQPSKLKSGCSACVMQETKRLAKEYFSYVEPEPEEPQDTDNKPKKTRRKKEDGV
ncbi:MAG: hypothetical protein J6Y78_03200 [Paludibacteraceae bacterium]|nr:hypothetical protein [Paludibacteraceae bacterium]